MRAAEAVVQQQLAQSAFTESPLQKYRQNVQNEGVEPRPAPVQLDTTTFTSSPLKDFAADVKTDLVYNRRPMLALPEPVSAVHTPAYSRGNYVMHSDAGLTLSVDLGPLLWMHADRSSEGSVGRILNEVA